jgi:hypothetical protein|tara:strand:- start:5 stop:406 length:402 start_codon:yes stop_codon:yes gene_type:complete
MSARQVKPKKNQTNQTSTEEAIRKKIRYKIQNIERDIFNEIRKDIYNEILAEYFLFFESATSSFDSNQMIDDACKVAGIAQKDAAKLMEKIDVGFNPGILRCLKVDIWEILEEEVKKIEDKVMGLVEESKSDK